MSTNYTSFAAFMADALKANCETLDQVECIIIGSVTYKSWSLVYPLVRSEFTNEWGGDYPHRPTIYTEKYIYVCTDYDGFLKYVSVKRNPL